jgi:hypothetical protein
MTKLTDILYQILLEEKKKRDRCLRIADRKYGKPSAYKSGAVVRCRQGDIWKKLKEDTVPSAEQKIDELPKGKLFDDAKNIESIFNRSKHSWSEVIELFEKNKSKEEYVNIEDIHITQPNIQSNKVKHIITNSKEIPAINVVEFPDGEKVIYDGHHRLVANWALGNEKIKTNLVQVKNLKENNLNNTYKTALAQTEKEALELVDKNWDEFGGEECNNGFCDIFAKNLAKHLPGSKIMSTEDNRSTTFGHVWVEYKGNYFDAETPNGVTSWKKLPWMVKFYNKNKEYPTDIEFINEAESLHKWFKRQGPKGKEGGWVDCNAPDGNGGYKACGRKEGEKRSKYPSCRPTPAQCKTKGKGKTWGKTK